MQPPLVSTIIPVFNRAAMLREAVASVFAQTYRPIELVIVDDGSTDDSVAIADALATQHDCIRVVHRTNGGAGLAREAGRLAAQGEFIQYLDSDDLLLPQKFAIQVAGLREHPECGVAYGRTRARFAGGTMTDAPWKRTGEQIETMFPAMLASRWWDTSTPLYRAELLRRAGPWTDLRREEDWEYDCRVSALGVRLFDCEAWVSETRFTAETQLSRDRSPAVLRDRAKAHALILGHARRAAIPADAPEMKHFSRELFLLARQCGAAGLDDESCMLFELARDASGASRDRMQFRVYERLARTFGWSRIGKLSCLSDRLRW